MVSLIPFSVHIMRIIVEVMFDTQDMMTAIKLKTVAESYIQMKFQKLSLQAYNLNQHKFKVDSMFDSKS